MKVERLQLLLSRSMTTEEAFIYTHTMSPSMHPVGTGLPRPCYVCNSFGGRGKPVPTHINYKNRLPSRPRAARLACARMIRLHEGQKSCHQSLLVALSSLALLCDCGLTGAGVSLTV